MRRTYLFLLLVLVGLSSRPLHAQEEARPLNVFLDCASYLCDRDFLRTEIVSANWVRDRSDADVHLLVTTLPTGGGGTRFTLAFLGQRVFAGLSDTLPYIAPQSNSTDDTRRGLSHTIQLGLVRFLARTPAGSRVAVTYAAATKADSQSAPVTHDPWNAWVFSLSANGYSNREESFGSLSVSGTVAANRVTEQWKTSLTISESYNDSRFDIGDVSSLFVQRNYSADLLQVKSLSPHWSAGLRAGVTSSTYQNERIAARITPAVEYDLFPYADATRRQLRFQYGLGVSAFSYYDTTQYGKVRETLPVQTLSTAYSQVEPWGSLNGGVDAVSYLSDLSRQRITYSIGANVRVVKGLSLSVSGSYQSIHDQFYIPLATISHDDALLRQTQQRTQFSQFLFIGVNYSFGSTLNNVVNPRFGSSGGGMMMIMQ
jgi:hypothetical protein